MIVTLSSVMNSMVQITWQLLKQQRLKKDSTRNRLTCQGIPHPQTPPLLHRWGGGLQGSSHQPCDSQGRLPESPTRGSSCYPRPKHPYSGQASPPTFHTTGQPAASVTRCSHHNHVSLPPTAPVLPTRSFQSICADYFHNKGHT